MGNKPKYALLFLLAFLTACSARPDVSIDFDPQKMTPYFYEGQAAKFELAAQGQKEEGLLADGEILVEDLRKFSILYLFAKAYHVSSFEKEDALEAAISSVRSKANLSGPLSDEDFDDAASHGLLSSLDPFSGYYSEEDNRQFRGVSRASNRFGAVFKQVPEGVKIHGTHPEGAASVSGLRPGDIILKARGVPLAGKSRSKIYKELMAYYRKDISLDILRGDKQEVIRLTKAGSRKPTNVSYKVFDTIGYVMISSFSEKTSETVEAVMARLKEKTDYKLNGLIIDLRSNPGGELLSVLDLTDLFLNDGLIVTMTGRYEERSFSAQQGASFPDIPIIIIQDGGSASASEIFAGAMRANKRANVVGDVSFGKIYAQTHVDMRIGGTAVVSTETYFLPNGESAKGGLKPDYEVADDPEREGDEQLEAALELLRKMISSAGEV